MVSPPLPHRDRLASQLLDKILKLEALTYFDTETERHDPSYTHAIPCSTLEEFGAHLSERLFDAFRSTFGLSNEQQECTLVHKMHRWLDGIHLGQIFHNYLSIYNKFHYEVIHAHRTRAESKWWYVCGTGTARDPCIVLAPAFELEGTAYLMKATNRWEILVPATSRDYVKVLPAPCTFHGATIEHEALQNGWAWGRCSSMGEAWTIDSTKIRSLLGDTTNLSFLSVTTYPFDAPVMEDNVLPYGDYSTSLVRFMLDTSGGEVYYVRIHFSLRLRRILDEIRAAELYHEPFKPQGRHRR